MHKGEYQQNPHIRKQESIIPSFDKFIKEGGLKKILGEETFYYKSLIVEGYEPGTFTLQERIDNPVFLGSHERNFDRWLESVVERELTDLRNSGEINLASTDDILGDITRTVREILDYRLDDWEPISKLIFNQEYLGILYRILLWLLQETHKERSILRENLTCNDSFL